MKNNTQKSPKYFRHLESGEIYFEGLDQKRELNLINQKTSSEYYLPGQYGEHDYFPFEEIPQPPAPIKEDAKHTAGEFDLNTMPLPSRKVIELRKNHTVIAELKQTIKGKIYTEDHDPELKANAVFLLQAVNSYPTLLKENEQLKEQVNVLREALKEASTILVHSINNEKGNKIKTAILKECPDVRDMMKMIRNVLSQTN